MLEDPGCLTVTSSSLHMLATRRFVAELGAAMRCCRQFDGVSPRRTPIAMGAGSTVTSNRWAAVEMLTATTLLWLQATYGMHLMLRCGGAGCGGEQCKPRLGSLPRSLHPCSCTGSCSLLQHGVETVTLDLTSSNGVCCSMLRCDCHHVYDLSVDAASRRHVDSGTFQPPWRKARRWSPGQPPP